MQWLGLPKEGMLWEEQKDEACSGEVAKRRVCFGKPKRMKRAVERVAKRRVCFGHKMMKRAVERVAKRRVCFGKHKRMKRAVERVAKRRVYMLW